jgi:hypothetical protein
LRRIRRAAARRLAHASLAGAISAIALHLRIEIDLHHRTAEEVDEFVAGGGLVCAGCGRLLVAVVAIREEYAAAGFTLDIAFTAANMTFTAGRLSHAQRIALVRGIRANAAAPT